MPCAPCAVVTAWQGVGPSQAQRRRASSYCHSAGAPSLLRCCWAAASEACRQTPKQTAGDLGGGLPVRRPAACERGGMQGHRLLDGRHCQLMDPRAGLPAGSAPARRPLRAQQASSSRDPARGGRGCACPPLRACEDGPPLRPAALGSDRPAADPPLARSAQRGPPAHGERQAVCGHHHQIRHHRCTAAACRCRWHTPGHRRS